jgi:hypothetical protein
MSEIKKVNVCGAEWTISQRNPSEDKYLEKVDGYCDYTTNEIVYDPHPYSDIPEGEDFAAPETENKRIVRHELVHAFLFESGLANDTGWARNETIVDWIARQFPKMLKAFQDAGAV